MVLSGDNIEQTIHFSVFNQAQHTAKDWPRVSDIRLHCILNHMEFIFKFSVFFFGTVKSKPSSMPSDPICTLIYSSAVLNSLSYSKQRKKFVRPYWTKCHVCRCRGWTIEIAKRTKIISMIWLKMNWKRMTWTIRERQQMIRYVWPDINKSRDSVNYT